jgi:hypothetical protein
MKKLLVMLLAVSSVAVFADDMQSTTEATNVQQAPMTSTASSQSQGSSSSDDLGNHLYIGGGAGLGWNDVNSPTAAFRADIGYNINQYWALEAGTTGLTQSGGAYNQNMQYYDLSVKGTLPMNDVFALTGQFGGAYGSPGLPANAPMTSGALDSGYSFFSAAGIQANVTKQVSLNLTDYFYYGSPVPQGNTNTLLAGLKYNF